MEKYILIDRGDYGQPSGYMVCKDGSVKAINIENVKNVPKNLIDTNLFILTSEENLKKSLNQKTMNKNNSFVMAENVVGQETVSRIETPYGGGMSVVTLQLGFDYTTVTAPGTADLSVLIGDAADAMRAKDGKLDNLTAAVANGLVVTGTFGSRTVEILNKLAKNQVRFHTMQGEAAAASYWSNKVPMKTLSSNIQGNPSSLDVDFQINQDGSQFNDKIRQVPGFRFTLSDFTALQIAVNEGEKVSFTFKVRSYGAAQIMELASA